MTSLIECPVIAQMRAFEIPTSKAKLKLLDAAELQVSEKGFDAVSVRDVTQLAKANVAAVNYHFGSREGMMGLMMARRMSPVHQKQLQNLDLLEKKRGSKTVSLEELLEAWLSPLFVQISKDKGKDEVLRLSVARILSLSASSLPDPLQNSGAELWKRYLKAFGKCLKEISAEELVWRLHLLNGAAIQSLMGTGSIQAWTGIGGSSESVEQRLSRLLRLAAPLMREGGMKQGDEVKPEAPQGTFDF